jgi:hypothetical protein
VGDRYGDYPHLTELAGELIHPHARLAVAIGDEAQKPRQVLRREPEPLGRCRVGVEEDDSPACHPAQLAQPAEAIAPVMVAEDRERCVETSV